MQTLLLFTNSVSSSGVLSSVKVIGLYLVLLLTIKGDNVKVEAVVPLPCALVD